jgi:flagellin
MRELAVQAVNDTNNIQDRQNLQLEVTALKEEIDRIAAVTTWAGKKLMHGSNDAGGTTPKTFTFQVGASQNPQDVITVDIKAMTSERLGLVDTLAYPTIDNLSETGGTTKAEVVANSITNNSTNGTISGAQVGNDYVLTLTGASTKWASGDDISFQIPVASGGVLATTVNLAFAATTGTSAKDVAHELAQAVNSATIPGYIAIANTSTETPATVTLKKVSSTSMVVENGKSVGSPTVTSKNSTITVNTFDQGETLKFNVEGREVSVTNAAASGYTQDVKGTAAAIAAAINAKEIAGVTATVVDNVVTVTKANFNITTVAGSQTAMRLADAALELVNTQRATLGAVSNRLEKTVSNMTNIVTNLQAGRGRIEDADFAAESTELAKTQILQQASMAMLSQANASKQSVMSLLQGR